MRDVMTHRGRTAPGCTPTRTRRSPIAVSASSISPAGISRSSNENGAVWVTYNGEIYNHARRARASSKRAGHAYRTHSDTETIVHAYEQWGDECVQRFRGMFAFADLGCGRRRLLLARDRLGVKPLYWARARRPAALRVGNQGHSRERPGCRAAQSRACCRKCWPRAAPPATTRCSRASTSCFRAIASFSRTDACSTEQYWDLPLDGPDPELDRARRRGAHRSLPRPARRNPSGCG